MSKILFACDLDNTLIHSWKRRQEGDICVEWLDGREQGFMSQEVCRLLRDVIDEVDFVPVTTRSVAQYRRIVWPQGCRPRFAVATHGVTLLDGEKIDEVWNTETRKTTEPALKSLKCMAAELEATQQFIRTRLVDDAYVFVYCKDEDESVETAMTYPVQEQLYRIRSGKKVYYIPRGVDKGSAVMRLKEKGLYSTVICAGDSEMDLAMLSAADIAFAPEALCAWIKSIGQIHRCSDAGFAQEMLREIRRMIMHL